MTHFKVAQNRSWYVPGPAYHPKTMCLALLWKLRQFLLKFLPGNIDIVPVCILVESPNPGQTSSPAWNRWQQCVVTINNVTWFPQCCHCLICFKTYADMIHWFVMCNVYKWNMKLLHCLPLSFLKQVLYHHVYLLIQNEMNMNATSGSLSLIFFLGLDKKKTSFIEFEYMYVHTMLSMKKAFLARSVYLTIFFPSLKQEGCDCLFNLGFLLSFYHFFHLLTCWIEFLQFLPNKLFNNVLIVKQ